MHVPDEAQVVLVPRCLAYRLPPFFNQLEDAILDARRVHGRALGEAADELVEELLGADLEVERVAAVLDADVEELCDRELWGEHGGAALAYTECEEGDVLVAVVDVVHDGHGCLARSVSVSACPALQCNGLCIRGALLLVDQVGDLEVQREVRLEVLRVASLHCRTVSPPRSLAPIAVFVRMKRCSGLVGASPNAP